MNEEQIFLSAVDIASLDERSEFLDRACAGDAELRQSVETLLRSNDSAGTFLEQPLLLSEARTVAASDEETSDGSSESANVESQKTAVTLDFIESSERTDALGQLDHYEILRKLGQGGMGVVYKALDSKLDRVVAVKILAPQVADRAVARKRFLREARSAAAITDPHVVAIYSVNEQHAKPYLVMEYVEGITLDELVQRRGKLGVDEIVRIGAQIARGLEAAHAQGLMHRDIKPQNVLLEDRTQRVKIADFGLARAVDDTSLTKTGTTAGTPQFIAPEQGLGHRVDHRSDLFSLGSVLYMMCVGHSPFHADSVFGTIRSVCEDAPPSLADIAPSIPSWLVSVIDQLLQKNPDDRFQSARAVAHVLERGPSALQDPPESQRTETFVGLEGFATSDDTPNLEPRSDRQPAPRRSFPRRNRLVSGAVLCLLIVALGVTELTGITTFAATFIRFATDRGQLVVEVDDPAIETLISQSGLTVHDTATGRKYAITVGEQNLQSGSYDINVTELPEGLNLSTREFTLTRGGRRILQITYDTETHEGPPPTPHGPTPHGPPPAPHRPPAPHGYGQPPAPHLDMAEGIAIGLPRGRLGGRNVNVMCEDDRLSVAVVAPEAAFLYVVLAETDGSVNALYPWIDGDWARREKEKRQTELALQVPSLMDRGKPEGCCTLLLLARDEPLEENRDLSELFSGLPHAKQEGLAGAWYVDGKLHAISAYGQAIQPMTSNELGGEWDCLQTVEREMQKLASVASWTAGVFFDIAPAGQIGPPHHGMHGWGGPGRDKRPSKPPKPSTQAPDGHGKDRPYPPRGMRKSDGPERDRPPQ